MLRDPQLKLHAIEEHAPANPDDRHLSALDSRAKRPLRHAEETRRGNHGQQSLRKRFVLRHAANCDDFWGSGGEDACDGVLANCVRAWRHRERGS
jgi:hypothetical protein